MLRELRVYLWAIGVVALVGVAYLHQNPAADIGFSEIFFVEGEFLGQFSEVADFFDMSVYVSSGVIALILAVFTKWAMDDEGHFGRLSQCFSFFIVVLLVGSLGMVQCLKFTSERPRPFSIIEFGGEMEFVPVGVFVDSSGHWRIPDDERSFPSGHTASSFGTVVLAVIPQRRKVRAAVFGAGCLFASVAGLMRILEGNHYLSDVIGAMGLMSLLILFLDWGYSYWSSGIDRLFFGRNTEEKRGAQKNFSL